MRVAFFASEKAREQSLGRAFCDGLAAHGDRGRVVPNDTLVADADVAVMVGVKSARIWRANRDAGRTCVMLDKGYVRDRLPGSPVWKYWRVSVNAHHPTGTLMDVARPHDRLDALGLEMKPWSEGGHVVIAGSSAKYHAFHGLPHPTTYARRIVAELAGREIVYRPKPSWREAVPIRGARYSTRPEGLEDALAGAGALVTHGSNACFEAVLAGVPCIVLGDAVARPISSTSLDDIEAPCLATDDERRQWLANLAYAQWTMAEFASGEAWAAIRPQMR